LAPAKVTFGLLAVGFSAVPLIVTTDATAPLAGEKLVMTGRGMYSKGTGLVAVPPSVCTLMAPLVASAGASTVRRVGEAASTCAVV
jgi:hypothetical protein